jgi:hypothetical protein
MYWQILWFPDPATGLLAAGCFYHPAHKACQDQGLSRLLAAQPAN